MTLVDVLEAELYIAHIVVDQISVMYGAEVRTNITEREILSAAEEKVKEFAEENLSDIKYDTIVRNDVHVYSGIVDIAERYNIDLIIMSTHGRTGVKRLLLGSVTEMVTRLAPCSVLVVRPTSVTI